MRVDGSTRALVTGASRGIGRALAECLAKRGATVGLLARSREELEALAARLPGGPHPVVTADVADRADTTRAIDAFAQTTGGIDLLVANAGLAHYGPYRELTPEREDQMLTVNVAGTLHTVRAALPHMSRGSHIAIVSSAAALRTFPSAAVYGATKAAQRGFADALRHELYADGISVTTVFPGEIATALHEHEKERMPAWYRGGPDAVPAEDLAKRILDAVEADERYLFHPPITKVLGTLQGLNARLPDLLLRRLRGDSAAPRRR